MQRYGKRILSLAETFNFPDACQVDIPIFSASPPAIYAADFKPQATYIFDIEFRNQDKIPRSLRVAQNDSAYFKIIGQALSCSKIATGLSVHVRVQFNPEELRDYTHELVCTTDREVFSIPIYCIGRRSYLEGPKSVTFVNCPVKQTLEKAISLRNTGGSAFEFVAHTSGSLSAYPQKGVIEAGSIFQLLLQFTPKIIGVQCESIFFEVERGDGLCMQASTEAFEVPVTLSDSEPTQMQTLIGTKCSRSVFIENRSEYSLKFKWIFGQPHKPDKSTRSPDRSAGNYECMNTEVRTQDGDEINAIYFAGRQIGSRMVGYGSSESRQSYQFPSDRSAALSIEDGVFTIEPSHGEVMFGTRREIRIIFSPAYARSHSALALCDIEGRQQPLSLLLEGRGQGPVVRFSFRSLDVGQVFISARHTYELVVANTCEIDAIFSVKPQASSAFSDCFSFSHDEGLISPQEYQAVDITFCSPDRLGKFSENFEFLFDGSPNPEIITIKGEVVGPTLYFKNEELDFGWVSYGFPVTTMVTLYNNSTVPVNFKLRTVEHDELEEDSAHVDGQAGSDDNDSGCGRELDTEMTSATLKNIEFDVKPCCGHIDALSSIELEVNFKPMVSGRLNWKLLVDAEHVRRATCLPVSAECRVPHITIDSCELNIGLCFLNYPKPFLLRLKNHDENLQAHYTFASSNAESGQEAQGLCFHAKNPTGVLPAATSTNILVDAIVSSRGYFTKAVFFSILGSQELPLAALITCQGEGPVINVEDDIIDWGRIPTLIPSPRSLLVTNETPIMARVSVIIHQEVKAFETAPHEFELAPFAQCTLTITAELNDIIQFTGLLEILVEDASSSHKVELRAVGKGSTIVFEPNLPATLNLGRHFDTTPLRRAFRVLNRGRRLQRLIWSTEDLVVQTRRSKQSNEGAVNNAAPALDITILPSRFELAPGKSTELVIEAKARCPQVAVCCIKCHAVMDRRGAKELIKKINYSAEFVAPELETIPRSLLFHIEKAPTDHLELQHQDIQVTNQSELPLHCKLSTRLPFSIRTHDKSVEQHELALRTAEDTVITVEFDPNFKEDPVSRSIEENLIIEFLEHPSIQHVPLHGEVLFPNLKLQTDLVDFGCILNYSESVQVVTLVNVSPLDVKYRWSFLISDWPHLTFKRGSKTSLAASSPSWLTKNQIMSAAPRLQSVADGSSDMQTDTTNLRRASIRVIAGDVPSVHSDPVIETNCVADSLLAVDNSIAQVGIEETLDITPLCGVIKPGEAQPAVFSFFGHPYITVDVCAKCEVEGGPSYQVNIKGESSEIEYSVDRLELNFGAVIYNQEAVECFNIHNYGQIVCEFQLELAELSDGTCKVEFSPVSGVIAAGFAQEVQVRVTPSRPEPFTGSLSLVVAKTVPRRIGIQGSAEFPHLLLNLPRLDEGRKNHKAEPPGVKEALRDVFSEHEKRLAQLFNDLETKSDDCVGKGFQKNYWELLEAERRFISILEICKDSFICYPRENSYPTIARKPGAQLRPCLPEYVLDFGLTILAQTPIRTIRLINLGNFKAKLQLEKAGRQAALDCGFSFSLEGSCQLLGAPVFDACSFDVMFDPAGAQLDPGPVNIEVLLKVSCGPSIPLRLKADVVVPNLIPNIHIIEFGEVIVGEAKLCTFQLHNPCPVPVAWRQMLPNETEDVPSEQRGYLTCTELRRHNRKRNSHSLVPAVIFTFEMIPSSGVLEPESRLNVYLKFCPSTGKVYKENMVLQLTNSYIRPCVAVSGWGVEPSLVCEPSSLQFDSILPIIGEDIKELIVRNPCPFPIEFYNLEYDLEYRKEDAILDTLTEYDDHECLLTPLRQPGEKLPKEFLSYHEKQSPKQEVANIPPLSDKPLTERVKAGRRQRPSTKTTLSIVDSIETDSTTDATKPVALSLARCLGVNMSNKQSDICSRMGIAIIVLGTPLSGKTKLSQELAQKYDIPHINIDDVVDHALKFDPSETAAHARAICRETVPNVDLPGAGANTTLTRLPAEHRLSKGRVKSPPMTLQQRRLSSEGFLAEKVADEEQPCFYATALPDSVLEFILRDRFTQPDCRFGLVVDGVDSQFCHSRVALCGAILRALGRRRYIFSVSLLRDLASLQAADALYEAALRAQERAQLEARLAEIERLEESEYDALSAEAQADVERVLAKVRIFRQAELEAARKEAEDRSLEERQMDAKKLEEERLAKKRSKRQETSKAQDRATSRANTLNPDATDRPKPLKNRTTLDSKAEEPLEEVPSSPKSLFYQAMEQKFRVFENEFRALCELLSTWDRRREVETSVVTGEAKETGNTQPSTNPFTSSRRQQRLSLFPGSKQISRKEVNEAIAQQTVDPSPAAALPPVYLSADGRRVQSPKKEALYTPPIIGVPHFIYKLPLPEDLAIGEPICQPVNLVASSEVRRPEPSLNDLLNRLQQLLPSHETVLEGMGMGQHGMPIPPPTRFSVIRRPSAVPSETEGIRSSATALTANNTGRMTFDNQPVEEEDAKSNFTIIVPRAPTPTDPKQPVQSGLQEGKSTTAREKYGGGPRRRISAAASRSKLSEVVEDLPEDSEASKSSPYRWIVPAGGEVTIQVKFRSDTVGLCESSLSFELLGSRKKFTVDCKGISQLPSLEKNPRLLFTVGDSATGENKVIQKKFIPSKGLFEFGPLIIEKTKERIKANEYPENTVELKLANNSAVLADVVLGFLEDVKEENFSVEPKSLTLLPGECQAIRLWAFPRTIKRFQDALVCCILNNPEPFLLPFGCDGVMPEIEVDTKVIFFEKVLLHRKESKTIVLRNGTLLPAVWKILGAELLGEDFALTPVSGIVPPMAETPITVCFRASRPYKASFKRNLRLEVYDKENIAGLVHVETILVQAEAYDVLLDIVFLKGSGNNGLNFGHLRVGEEVKQQMILKNKGSYEISYKFVFQTENEVAAQICDVFHLSPVQGNLPLTERTATVNAIFRSFKEVAFDGDSLLHCEVYEPHYKQGPELIASIPIPVNVKVHFSKFSIFPSKEVSFGPMLLHSRKSRQFGIENCGDFDFRFNIMSMTKAQELRLSRAVTKEGRRTSRHRIIDLPLTKGGANRLQLGPFTVNPASGVVPTGSCQAITVDCTVDNLGYFKEELCVDISDRDASKSPFGASYMLLAEACVPYINVDDIADIFEEHRICKNYEMLQAIKDTEIPEGIFVVESNRFHFADTLVGTRCQARFRLTNPSKVPADVHFSVKTSAGVGETGSSYGGGGQARPRNPSTMRSNTSRSGITGGSSDRRSVWGKGQGDAFEVEPSRSLIPPCGSVYVSVIFCPQSIQVFSGLFEAAVESEHPSQQADGSSVQALEHTDAQKTLAFELCGQGHLPRISILRPSLRNLRGELTCVFPRIRAREISKREIVFINDGNFVSTVNINLTDPCGVFSIECPEEEGEKVIYLRDTRKDVDLYEEPWREHKEMRVWAGLSGRPHTGSFQVRPQETLQLYARFQPTAADARFAARLQVCVVNNAYDEAVIELVGETREEKTGVQVTGLPRLERARAEAIQSAVASMAAQPPKDCPFSLETTLPKLQGQSWLKELDVAAVDELLDNHLDFGDCAVGETVKRKFFLTYTRGKPEVEDSGVSSESGIEEGSVEEAAHSQEGLPSFQFEWPQNHPQLRFEPVTGQLHSGQSVHIKATFSSSTPVRLRFAPVLCTLRRMEKAETVAMQSGRETQAIEQNVEEGSEQMPSLLPSNSVSEVPAQTVNPDTTLRRHRSAHKSSGPMDSVSIQRNVTDVSESPHTDDQPEAPVELLVSAIADHAHFQCDASEMDFGEVQICDSQRRQVAISNKGFVTLKFAFTQPTNNAEKSYTNPGTLPESFDSVGQIPEAVREESPFRIHPIEGTVLPGATQQIDINFCPKEARKYSELVTLRVDNTETTALAKTPMTVGASNSSQNLAQSKGGETPTEPGYWPINLLGVAIDRVIKFSTVSLDGGWTELDTLSHLSLESPDADAHLVELSAVGVGSRASRNLLVTNTSQTCYRIHFRNTEKATVKRDEIVSFSPSFLALEPGVNEQIEVTFTGQLQETVQSKWEVRIPELDAAFPLTVVGRTREPKVTFDRTNFTLPTTLVGHTVSRTEVCLVNRESDAAYDFAISDKSCLCENLTNRLTVCPRRGRLQPGERLPLTISFCPKQPRRFNFNLICHVKGKKSMRLNVKAESFTVQTSAWLDGDFENQRRGVDLLLEPSLGETATEAALTIIRKFDNSPALRSRLVDLQFGEVACGSERVRQITLINHGTFDVEFTALIHSLRRPIQKTRPNAQKMNKLTNNLSQMVFIEPSNGLIAAGSRVTLSAHFLPHGRQKDPACPPRHIYLDNNLFALVTVRDGPSFGFHLTGSSLPPPIEISPDSLDFGNQFVTSAGFENLTLPISLRNTGETESISIECMQPSCSAFHCIFEPCVLEPSSKTVDNPGHKTALISFTPAECRQYRDSVSFRVNGATVYTVPLKGRGASLELDVEVGNLLLGNASSKLRASSNTGRLNLSPCDTTNADPVVVTPSNFAFLGRLRVGQSSRRTVKIINKGKIPLKLLGISLLPKSPVLNEVHVSMEQPRKCSLGDLPRLIDIEAIRHSVPATADKPTLKLRREPHMFLAASGGWLELEIVFTPSAVVAEFLEQVSLAVAPIQVADITTVATVGRDGKFVWIPAFSVGGSCRAIDIHLASPSMMLGKIVVGSQISRKLAMTNRGDLGSSFQWDDKTFGPEVTISPMKGYLHPHTTINFTVTMSPKSFDLEIRYEGVRCLLENGASIQVTLAAICVSPTVAKDVLQFCCPVRDTDTRGVPVTNHTNSRWFLKPVVKGSEWSGAETFEVGPQETACYDLIYHPLKMTVGEEKHRGSVFFPLPDGMGLLYHVAGCTEPPKPMGKFNIDFRSREPHEFYVDVQNWLPRPQRFTVTRMLVKPDKVDMNLNISGLEHIDVPGNAKKQYKLTVSAQKEGLVLLKVTFTNMETKEYQFCELQLKSLRPKSLSTINLHTAVRRSTTYKLALENPLPLPTTFQFVSTIQQLFCPSHLSVPANSTGFATLEFLPLIPGEYKGRLEASSHDLGVLIHDLDFLATTAPLEEAVSFEVHLGQASSKMVRFSNLTKSKADFTCKISNGDFQCDKLMTVAPGIEASLPVTFEPITIGETTATLTVSNAQAGEYVFPLHGTAKLPVPQGPIVVHNKETAHIIFKNVFPVTTEFFVQVENPAFHVAQASRVVRPQREFHIPILLEANLTPTISRTNEEQAEGTVICSKLVVTCARSFAVPTSGRTEKWTSKSTASEEAHREFQIPSHLQWVYYLKGVLN